jgi:glycosyltransferase involved in cell wall biosynthesis
VPTTELRSSDAVLCHDVGPLTHPDLYDEEVCVAYRAIYEEIARVGPHVVFVSNASRNAFHQLWPNHSLASSRVIYPPLRTDLPQIFAAAVPPVTGPFLLTVGSIGSRKNQARCIAAFRRSGLAHRGTQYVVCGAGEPGFETVTHAARRTPGVVLLPYVSDSELAWLYRNADGFVLASLLEGFGIPLAEAIANALVPIVSKESVLDEVAGPGALTVDPLDEHDIACAMTALAEMDVAERKSRLVLLEESISRFDSEAFRQGWSTLFAEIGTRRR